MPNWVVATRNEGKLRELVPMFGAAGITVVTLTTLDIPESQAEDSLEVFDTFEANALAKARYFAALTGVPCLADDSGLCVDALAGAPGVRSKRFAVDCGAIRLAGESDDARNNRVLISACRASGSPAPWTASFRCAVAWVHGAQERVATGRVDGTIVQTASGDHGFGYDPHFQCAELGVTLADASTEVKSAVSHRARAFAALLRSMQLPPHTVETVDEAARLR